MQTIYIYLSWTGWIWFVIAGACLAIQWARRKNLKLCPGFPVVVMPGKTANCMEAKQTNEQ